MGAPARPPDRRRPYERVPLPSLSAEPAWWAAAPLRAGGRDLASLPDGALDQLIDHYLPFVLRALDRHRHRLAAALGDTDDIRGQAGEWLLYAIHRYDPARGAPFAGYLAALVPYWVQQATRAGAYRSAADTERQLATIVEQSLATVHRLPTYTEIATRLGPSPQAAAARITAAAVSTALRSPANLDAVDHDRLPLAGSDGIWNSRAGQAGAGADTDLLAREDRRLLTEALLFAAHDDTALGSINARGLWTLLLETFGGLTRADLANVGRCSPKPIAAAQRRLIASVRERLAA